MQPPFQHLLAPEPIRRGQGEAEMKAGVGYLNGRSPQLKQVGGQRLSKEGLWTQRRAWETRWRK